MLAFGRRSSSHPFFSWATAHGMRTDAPRSDVPWPEGRPVGRLVCARQPVGDTDAVVLDVLFDVLSECLTPGDDGVPAPSSRIDFVEKFV